MPDAVNVLAIVVAGRYTSMTRYLAIVGRQYGVSATVRRTRGCEIKKKKEYGAVMCALLNIKQVVIAYMNKTNDSLNNETNFIIV